jgi:hypothetical protein
MPSQRLSAASHLFTVRLWREDLGDDHMEWRGQVTHALSSEVHYFRRWDELSAHLLAMAAAGTTAPPWPLTLLAVAAALVLTRRLAQSR